ncbi:MAG: F0F1 ATP synthase subunit alpha, partial [Candidatus Moranbacteria bacterium]|nr:F0F1 ATP synthase subunit alpha [Candidatus Moranbacteria bacterium]
MSKDFIIESLKKQISGWKAETKSEKIGRVIEVGDGIARVSGLSDAMASEMLEFITDKADGADKGGSVFGVALNLEEDQVGAMILGEYEKIKEGDTVKSTGKILSVPVGENMIGRVINPLGQAVDGKG